MPPNTRKKRRRPSAADQQTTPHVLDRDRGLVLLNLDLDVAWQIEDVEQSLDEVRRQICVLIEHLCVDDLILAAVTVGPILGHVILNDLVSSGTLVHGLVVNVVVVVARLSVCLGAHDEPPSLCRSPARGRDVAD